MVLCDERPFAQEFRGGEGGLPASGVVTLVTASLWVVPDLEPRAPWMPFVPSLAVLEFAQGGIGAEDASAVGLPALIRRRISGDFLGDVGDGLAVGGHDGDGRAACDHAGNHVEDGLGLACPRGPLNQGYIGFERPADRESLALVQAIGALDERRIELGVGRLAEGQPSLRGAVSQICAADGVEVFRGRESGGLVRRRVAIEPVDLPRCGLSSLAVGEARRVRGDAEVREVIREIGHGRPHVNLGTVAGLGRSELNCSVLRG